MTTFRLWFGHAASIAAICATVFATMTGCEGGGGKVTLRFGTYNFGSCEDLVAEFDLASGRSSIARLPDGSLDCALDLLLADEGCTASFVQLQDGHTIRVRIHNCEIPATTDLFECGFSTADALALRMATESSCECYERQSCRGHNPPLCDETPTVCIGNENGPASCEICNNDIDDNGDGKADCDDEDCEMTDVCGWESSSTTITCSTTTNSVTTTDSVTSTSLVVMTMDSAPMTPAPPDKGGDRHQFP